MLPLSKAAKNTPVLLFHVGCPPRSGWSAKGANEKDAVFVVSARSLLPLRAPFHRALKQASIF